MKEKHSNRWLQRNVSKALTAFVLHMEGSLQITLPMTSCSGCPMPRSTDSAIAYTFFARQMQQLFILLYGLS